MTKLKIPPPQSRMELAESLGLVNDKNRAAFLAVEEMLKRPLTAEQARAQIAKGNPHLVRYGDPKPKDRD